MISSALRHIISKLGFTEPYIQRKVEEVLYIAKSKNLSLEPNTLLLVCYDMNGPLTSTRDAALYPIAGIQEAVGALKKNNVERALVSGWDMTTLAYFRDQRLVIPSMGIVGEHGAVWEWEGQIQEVAPVPLQDVCHMKEILFREAARERMKIAIQGNVSSRITGVFFEAEGPKRGNLSQHILVVWREISTKDIFESLQDNKEEFSWDGDRILFPCKQPYILEIDRVLRTVLPCHSVRLALEQDRIALWIDHADKEPYSLEDMKVFIQKILPPSWKYMIHDDFGVDIIFNDEAGSKMNKETTANLLAQKVFPGQSPILTNVGDRSSDAFIGENSIFFPQRGTSAELHCKESNIPYVSVEHGGDYSLILAAVLERKQAA